MIDAVGFPSGQSQNTDGPSMSVELALSLLRFLENSAIRAQTPEGHHDLLPTMRKCED